MNPVAWRGTSSNVSTIKELDAAELRELAYVVLSSLATDSDYTGVVKLSAPAGYTVIGTWEDSFRNSDGSISSNTQSLSQDLTTSYTSITSPPDFFYANSTSAYPMRLSNTSIMNTLADNILYYCTTEEGPNSYRLNAVSPAATYGGTWQNLGYLNDAYGSYPGAGSEIWTLWHRIDDGGYSGSFLRPLKRGTADGTINQFTDTDIYRLTRIVRQRIVDTGIGQYSFGVSAPGTGTWVSVGTAYDVIYTATGTFTSNYAGPENYASDYAGPAYYSTSYTQDLSYSADYLSTAVVPTTFTTFSTYTGEYLTGAPTFTGTTSYQNEAYSFTKYYTGPGNPISGQGVFSGPESNYASLSSKTIYYLGPGPIVVVPTTPYLGPSTYTGNNSVPFTGPPVNYLGPAPPTTYTSGPFPGYVGPKGTFTKASSNFTGPGAANSTNFLGPAATYLGVGNYLQEDASPGFAGPGASYAGPKGTFFGPPGQSFQNPNFPYARAYQSATPTYYTGSIPYVGVFDWTGPYYLGPLYDFFPSYFQGNETVYTGGKINKTPFAGLTFSGNFSSAQSFFGVTVYPDGGPNYQGEFIVPDAGTNFNTDYTNEDGQQFTGTFTDPDASQYTTGYQSDLSNYSQGPVSFVTLNTTPAGATVLTKYLWRRVA